MTHERSAEGAWPSAAHVAVVLHSQQGHVARLASRVAAGVTSRANVAVDCLDLGQSHSDLFDRLHGADAIILGCPTFMGGPPAQNPREIDLATAEYLGRLVATTATAMKLGRALLLGSQTPDETSDR